MKEFGLDVIKTLGVIATLAAIVITFLVIVTPQGVETAALGPFVIAGQEPSRPTMSELISRVLDMDFVLANESRRVYNANNQLAATYTFLDLLGEEFPIERLNRTHAFTSFSTNTGDVIAVHHVDGRLHLHFDLGETADGARAHYVFALSRNFVQASQ